MLQINRKSCTFNKLQVSVQLHDQNMCINHIKSKSVMLLKPAVQLVQLQHHYWCLKVLIRVAYSSEMSLLS